MGIAEKFWNATLEEMARGYVEEEEYYECLLCGKKIEKGIVYQEAGIFYETEKYMKIHIQKAHVSVYEYLLGLDKKTTGLSEHQNNLLKLFYQGKSDGEVQSEMGIGSSSTIRNHRFVLKEKERQARVFLTLMELLKGKDRKPVGLIAPHPTAVMLDDRYNTTEEEQEKILKKLFPHGTDKELATFDVKEKSKLVVLRQLVKRFEGDCIYSEKQVNEIIKTANADFATIRRYFIEYGFMDRKPDGSEYWLKRSVGEKEEEKMDRKRELKQQYMEMKTEAGVYQIRNLKNQKILVVSTPNLKTMNGGRTKLQGGGCKSRELQEEWNSFGEAAFVFEVLEVLEEKEEGFFDRKEELRTLERKWLDKLQPYGDKGYNKKV